MKNKNLITILSVSYNSSHHLKRLYKNLLEKAGNPLNIQFIIIDNTNGKDSNLNDLVLKGSKIKIILNFEKCSTL